MGSWAQKYRCRNCGKVYTKFQTNSWFTVMTETNKCIRNIKSDDPLCPYLYESHMCDGDIETGNRGIADFIGWEYKDD